MNETSNNTVNYVKPIQVKRISQLETLSIKINENNEPSGCCEYTNVVNNIAEKKQIDLTLNNAFLLVAYPSTENIPHHYKLPLSDIINYCYISTKAIVKLKEKVESLTYYVSYYHNILFDDTDITDEMEDNIADYWCDRTAVTELIEYWSTEHTDNINQQNVTQDNTIQDNITDTDTNNE